MKESTAGRLGRNAGASALVSAALIASLSACGSTEPARAGESDAPEASKSTTTPSYAPGQVITTINGKLRGADASPYFYVENEVTDEHALHRADGSRVEWYPNSPAYADISVETMTVEGLVVTADTGGGGLESASSVRALLDIETGERLWEIPNVGGLVHYSAEYGLLLTSSGEEMTAYTMNGEEAWRETLLGYSSAHSGTVPESSSFGPLLEKFAGLDISGDQYVTQVGNIFVGEPTTIRVRKLETGEVTATYDDYDTLPGDLKAIVNPWAGVRPDLDLSSESVWRPNVSDSSFLAVDGTTLHRTTATEDVWAVEIGESQVLDVTDSQILLRGPTGDYVFLSVADGSQKTVLSLDSSPALTSCDDHRLLTDDRLVMQCGDDNTSVVILAV